MLRCFLVIMGLIHIGYGCEVVISVDIKNIPTSSRLQIRLGDSFYKLNTFYNTDTIDIDPGNYPIQIYSDDILISSQTINIDCSKILHRVKIDQKQNTKLIDEVVVKGFTKEQVLNNSPFSVQVISLKEQRGKVGSVGDLLNQASGVKIRNDGNMGSTSQINLGGLQGKAIRIFRDGIPVELFGHGFHLGMLSANMLDRVEIYKGVMPVYLSSDALGGGVNLVTRELPTDMLEASYEFGSFNTHRATLHTYKNLSTSSNSYLGLTANYNYSDNDYTVIAPFTDASTGKKYFEKTKRFHDATRSSYSEIYFGLKDRNWADDLRYTFIYSNFYKELQHDNEMKAVYGDAHSQEYNITSLLTYHNRFFEDKLSVNSSLSHSYFNTSLIDTSTNRYDWSGKVIQQGIFKGEINRGNDQKLDYNLYSARINTSYQLSALHALEVGELYYYLRRKGSDPLGAISPVHQIDVLNVPAYYTKNILAASLRSQWLSKKLESIIGVKHYSNKTEGYTTDNYNFSWLSATSNQRLGYMAAVKWFGNNYHLKSSYEYATRIPDESEIFGDGIMIKENLDLIPERSHNVNLNGQYDFVGIEKNKGFVSVNLFYRNVKNAIFLQPDIPFSRYINFYHIRILGAELETKYAIHKNIDAGFNVTYQDIRRIKEASNFAIYEGARVPNVPFFFGNFLLQSKIPHVLRQGDRLFINYTSNYTHRFYLTNIPREQEPNLFGHANDIDSELLIPNNGKLGQLNHDAGITYDFANKKLQTSFEILNMMDDKRYDNFNVQKPGRSFHLKLVYRM